MDREKRDGLANTFFVAVALCLVCSAAVAGIASALKARQNANSERYKKQNVLAAAGLYNSDMQGEKIDEMFEQWVIARIVQLPVDADGDGETDAGAGKDVTDEVGLEYDQAKASEDPEQRGEIDPKEDVASLKTRENYSYVYMIKSSPENDTPSKYVFPIRGKGLWSIMWGFVSIDADMENITGLSYYDQGETPGLGGEVENPNWKAKWEKGIPIFDQAGNVVVEVAKGGAAKEHQVDGLAGATITSNGVTNMLQFWLGEDGFGPFMKKVRGGAENANADNANASKASDRETGSTEKMSQLSQTDGGRNG